MKKILILNTSTIVLGFLLFLNIDRLLAYTWNWAPVFALLPVAAGVLVVLLQEEDKSYKYLPKLIASSLIFSFVTIFLVKLFVYFGDNVNASVFKYFNPFKDYDEIFGHFGLAGMYFFGGLIGLVVRGVNLVFFPERRFKINLEISFLKSFVLGAIFLLAANFYYVFEIGFPHHGRWKLELPVTSLFLALYLVLFFSYAKRAIKDSKYNYFIWAYNLLLSLVFLSNVEAVRVLFQDEMYLYFSYIAVAPYIMLLGLGLLGFIALSFIFKNVFSRPKKKTIFIALIIVILAILISAFLVKDKIKAAYIVKEIRKSNYCQIDSDCVDAFAGTGGQCPFGCHAFVNKGDAERIKRLVDSFNSTCVYQCMYCPTTRCENGICTAVCDERKSKYGYFKDAISGLEINYPPAWDKVNIRQVEDEDKRSIRFDYINGNETKFLFSLSFYPFSFSLDKIYSQDNQRPIYQTGDYVITVAEGEIPSSEDYGLLFYGIDEILSNLEMDNDSFRQIETGEDIYWQYKDDEYGFNFTYPSGLKIYIGHDTTIEYSERSGMGGFFIDKTITFAAPNGGPGLASINIYDNPDVETIDEWLKMKNDELVEKNKKYPWNSRVVEKERIDIDGREAIITYKEDDIEAYEYEKTAAFFKDGKLFTIYGRCKDCDKWWEGFKFGKQKAYKNEEYNFSVIYPVGWQAYESLEHIGPFVAFSNEEYEERDLFPKVKISIESTGIYAANQGRLSILQNSETNNFWLGSQPAYRTSGMVNKDEIEGKKLPYNFYDSITIPTKINEHDSYIVMEYFEKKYSQSDRQIFNQMVEDFRFGF